MPAVPSSFAIAARSGLIGSKPALSIVASSMPERYSQPIFCSIDPVAALSAFASAASTSLCCASRLCSRNWSNAPQRVLSAGIGFAAIHLPLA